MTDVISRARAVMEAATPGPWRADDHGEGGVYTDSDDMIDRILTDHPREDARAIALAVNVMPAMLDLVEAVRNVRDGGSFEAVQGALAAVEAALREEVSGDR